MAVRFQSILVRLLRGVVMRTMLQSRFLYFMLHIAMWQCMGDSRKLNEAMHKTVMSLLFFLSTCSEN